MSARNLDRHTALRRANVDDSSKAFPGEFCRECLGSEKAASSHTAQEHLLREAPGIECRIAARRQSSALGLTSLQRSCQQTPVLVVPCIQMLQQASDIGALATIKVKVGVALIGIGAVRVTPQESQGDKCIKKVAGATRVQTDACRHRLKVERSAGQLREHVKLNSAKECLGFPEGISNIEDVVR